MSSLAPEEEEGGGKEEFEDLKRHTSSLSRRVKPARVPRWTWPAGLDKTPTLLILHCLSRRKRKRRRGGGEGGGGGGGSKKEIFDCGRKEGKKERREKESKGGRVNIMRV